VIADEPGMTQEPSRLRWSPPPSWSAAADGSPLRLRQPRNPKRARKRMNRLPGFGLIERARALAPL